MTPPKTTTPARKREPAKSKAVAAREESGAAADELKTITWRGLKFTIPAKLPAETAWLMAEIADGTDGVVPIVRFVNGMIGEEQTVKLRRKLAADSIPMDDLAVVLDELTNAILGAYGMTPGEQ